MRFFFVQRRSWPTVGVALAVGFLIGDCLFVVGPYMDAFRAGWLWPLLLGALGMYLCLGAGLDLAVQLLGRGAAAGSVWARMALILAVAAGLVLAADEVRSLLLLAVAAVFATLALGRFTWPLAALAAAVALYPAVVGSPVPAVGGEAAVPPAAAARPGAPSFVVAVLDTVRRDHTSAYGYHRDTTPNLARLAARGIRFDRAYTTGCWSLPSHASLFTGLFTSRHGAHNERLELDGRHPTLAELLAEHGYETANFTANPWIGPGTGMTRGFQRNHESWRRYQLDLMLLAKRVYFALAAPNRDKGGSDLVVGIRRWLEERDPARPYFLFVNVFEAHGPYQYVPRAFRRRFADPDLSLQALESSGTRVFTATQNGNRLSERDASVGVDLLDGAIAAADSVLGQVLELVGDDAIAVVLADHGELFGEHALFGHSHTLYEPLIRIPMVMAGETLPKGLVVKEIVSIADIMPTLLAMAGVEAPEVDGLDLRPLIAEGGDREPRQVRAEQFRAPAARARGWALHHPGEADYLFARKQAVVGRGQKRIVAADGSDRGYDLLADPAEERPFPGSQSRLSARVPEAEAAETAATLDPIQRMALELLGYLQ
jgi:arylsulfatase A-like enzyme